MIYNQYSQTSHNFMLSSSLVSLEIIVLLLIIGHVLKFNTRQKGSYTIIRMYDRDIHRAHTR